MSCASSFAAYVLGFMMVLPGPPMWETTKSGDGDFAFSMPVRPILETVGGSNLEQTIETTNYLCVSEGCRYILRRSKYSRPVPAERIIAHLARVRETYFKENIRAGQGDENHRRWGDR